MGSEPLIHLNERAALVLRTAADHAEKDDRGPRAAVATLWSRLHADHGVLRTVFDALGREADVGDITGYLGRVLEKKTALERAQLCRQAADRLESGVGA